MTEELTFAVPSTTSECTFGLPLTVTPAEPESVKSLPATLLGVLRLTDPPSDWILYVVGGTNPGN